MSYGWIALGISEQDLNFHRKGVGIDWMRGGREEVMILEINTKIGESGASRDVIGPIEH